MFDAKLTDAERERLALLMEECAEVLQIGGKILRHGYSSFNPTIEDSATNREDLVRELGHVKCAMRLMANNKDINHEAIDIAAALKWARMGSYLHYQ